MRTWLENRWLRFRYPLGSVWIGRSKLPHLRYDDAGILVRVVLIEGQYYLQCFSPTITSPYITGKRILKLLHWTRASNALWTLAVMKGRWDGV